MTTNLTTAEDRLATLGLHLPDAPRHGNSRTSWCRICARRSRRYGSAELVRWTARVACASSAALGVHEPDKEPRP